MGKTIVITGAGIGLGRALARRFSEDGHTVVLLGRTLSKVQAVAEELGDPAMAVGCDVAAPDSVRQAFAAIAGCHPHIDVLINNAAVYQPFLIEEATDDQVLSAINTNLAGAVFCCRSAIPMMQAGGHILNVSSESVEVPFPHLSIYQSTKAGLERLSLSLQRELEASRIRVTTVRAGQMMEPDRIWDVEPAAAMRFAQAAAASGLNLRERPISQFTSAVEVFRALIDLPADIHDESISLHARRHAE